MRTLDGARRPGDAGVTMIEVTVSMTIMTVAMAIFTSAFLQIYRTTSKTESLATAQARISTLFQRMDREVHYAAGISLPAQVGSDFYVEYLMTNTGTPTCVELRLQASTAQLQRRSWTSGALPFAPTDWLPLLVPVAVAQPFIRVPADAAYNYQRLTLHITALAGYGQSASARETNVTFVALNTSIVTSSDDTCIEGRTA